MLRLNVTSLLAKIESSYATDPVPTGAANTVLLVGKPTLTPMQDEDIQRDLLRTFFGNDEKLPSSIYGKLEFQCEAAGSGTAGTAPAWGALLRACGLSETVTAAPITGTGQAGGTTTTIPLAAGASSTDNFYSGMPIAITSGTAAGQSGIIVAYNGTTKVATVISSSWVATDATSQYSIGANVAYRPITNSIESVTLYFNIDGVKHAFIGARGSVACPVAVNTVPTYKFSFMGLFVPIADTAMPTVSYSAWKVPQPYNKANTPFASLHNYSVPVSKIDLDLGNSLTHHEYINATEQIVLVDRKTTGAISVEAATVATKDWWTLAKNATTGPLVLSHGTVAGNKLAISAPAVQLIDPKYGETNGIASLDMNLGYLPVLGNDELAIVTY